jgi:hypothetical protein
MCRIRRENRRSAAIRAHSITIHPIHAPVSYVQYSTVYSREINSNWEMLRVPQYRLQPYAVSINTPM